MNPIHSKTHLIQIYELKTNKQPYKEPSNINFSFQRNPISSLEKLYLQQIRFKSWQVALCSVSLCLPPLLFSPLPLFLCPHSLPDYL